MSDKKIVKLQFQAALQPMIELFEHKKAVLNKQDWENFILLAKKSILSNPDQFLSQDLSMSPEIGEMIDELFQEYLENKLIYVWDDSTPKEESWLGS